MESHKEINKTAGRTEEVPCLKCKGSTKHQVLASVDLTGEDTRYGVQYWAWNQIVECKGCESISFRTVTGDDNEVDQDEDGQSYYPESITLYPSRDFGHSELADAYLLPDTVGRIYSETIKALNNGLLVITGIAIRALVETICKDRNAPGGNLAQKIDGLVTLGVLPPDGATTLHKLRTLGNNAAHEVKPHKPEQLKLAIDVCEHLLKGVYLIPHYANQTFT